MEALGWIVSSIGAVVVFAIMVLRVKHEHADLLKRKPISVVRDAPVVPVAEPVDESSEHLHEPPRDHWEGGHWDVVESFAISADLLISYRDGAGQRTERSDPAACIRPDPPQRRELSGRGVSPDCSGSESMPENMEYGLFFDADASIEHWFRSLPTVLKRFRC